VQLGRYPFTTKAPLRRGFRLRLVDARHLAHRPRAPGWKEGGVGRPRGEAPLQVRSPPQQWRAADPYALHLTLSRRPRPRDRGVAASAFLALFTLGRGREILRSSHPGSCIEHRPRAARIASVIPTPSEWGIHLVVVPRYALANSNHSTPYSDSSARNRTSEVIVFCTNEPRH
jgi:hypothetical protein